MNDLSDFSEVIKRLGEKRWEEQEAKVAKMRADLPALKLKIKEMTSEVLIDHLISYSCKQSNDINETVIWCEVLECIKQETISRLERARR